MSVLPTASQTPSRFNQKKRRNIKNLHFYWKKLIFFNPYIGIPVFLCLIHGQLLPDKLAAGPVFSTTNSDSGCRVGWEHYNVKTRKAKDESRTSE